MRKWSTQLMLPRLIGKFFIDQMNNETNFVVLISLKTWIQIKKTYSNSNQFKCLSIK